MKKKLSAFLAVLLGALSISAPAQVFAEDTSNYGKYADPLTIETHLFTYEHGNFSAFSEDVLPFDYFSMVTGVCYHENETEPYAYIVQSFGRQYWDVEKNEVASYPDGKVFDSSDRSVLYADDLKTFFDEKDPEIGDLFVLDDCDFTELFPHCMKLGSAQYLGNASALLGDEVVEAVRHEVAQSIVYMKHANISVDDSVITKGDVTGSGEVGIVDVLAVNQALLSLRSLSAYGELAADVNHNGTIDDGDAMKILKSLVGLETLD